MSMTHRVPIALLLGAAFLLGACTTSKGQYQGIDEKLARQDYRGALQQISDAKEEDYGEKNRAWFYLDAGMLLHYAGEYEKSNEYLTDAENAIEQLYTESVSRAAGSFILNDNTTEYAGEDYEDVYTNVFKALNYLALGQAEEAGVETRKVHVKLTRLADKYPVEEEAVKKEAPPLFRSSALAHYLSMQMYRMDREWDEAEIDRRKIAEAITGQPGVYLRLADPEQAIALADDALPTAIPEGRGVVSVVAFNGLGPEKVARQINVNTLDGCLNISSTVDDKKEGDVAEVKALFHYPQIKIPIPLLPPGYNFTVELPEMRAKRPLADRIRVVVDGAQEVELFPIENIARAAEVTFARKVAGAYTKTFVRAGLKFAAAIAASEAANRSGGGLVGALVRFGSSTLASATEKADLRLSYFFPGEAYAGELAVDPGEHAVTVVYLRGGSELFRETRNVTVKPNSVGIVEAFYLGVYR